MAELRLLGGSVVLLDDEDLAPALDAGPWHLHAKPGKRTYAIRHTRNAAGRKSTQAIHRWLLQLTDPRVQVDHVNLDGLDNRRCNLRMASASQNQQNRLVYSNNTTGVKGVSPYPRYGKYVARICANGKRHCIGYFDTLQEAEAAVRAARVALHGEFTNHGVK